MLLTGLMGAAYPAAASPSAQNWYHALSPKDPPASAFLHRILMVTGIKDGRLLTPDIDTEAFSEDTYLDLIDGRETEMGLQINQRSETIQDYHPPGDKPEQIFAAAFRFTSADTIIYAPPGEEHWSIYRRDAQVGVKKEFMVKGPDEVTEKAIKKWIIAKFGYHGVLLAQDHNYLLAAMYQEVPEGGSAMLVLDSDNLLRIKKSQMAGSALLRRLDCHRSICVFEIMIPGASRYPIGSKIFF